MTKYSTDPQWSDITPLPTDEGGPNPLAAIAYSPEYEEAMSYLRAVMAANELSERVLDLTEIPRILVGGEGLGEEFSRIRLQDGTRRS